MFDTEIIDILQGEFELFAIEEEMSYRKYCNGMKAINQMFAKGFVCPEDLLQYSNSDPLLVTEGMWSIYKGLYPKSVDSMFSLLTARLTSLNKDFKEG